MPPHPGSRALLPTSVAGWLQMICGAPLILAFIMLACVPHQTVADLGWHVAQGRWMVEHLWPYDRDELNYPNLHHPVIDEYPVFQVELFLFSCLGLYGPPLLSALGFGGLIYLNLRAPGLEEASLPRPRGSYSTLVGLSALMITVQLRPHLFTYLCITGFGLFLMRHREQTRVLRMWPLFLLQAIWVNSHSGFVIGPAMVGLFGFEMTLRRNWTGIYSRLATLTGPAAPPPRRQKTSRSKSAPIMSEDWTTARFWSIVFALDCLACLVNPYGPARLWLPFYQQEMTSLRAFVSEMQPLRQPILGLYEWVSLFCLALLLYFLYRSRGRICWSWAVLAAVFYLEALPVQKYWPIFALFLPLLGLSTAVFSPEKEKSEKTEEPFSLDLGIEIISSLVMLTALYFTLSNIVQPGPPYSPVAAWRDFLTGRTELAVEAVHWMRAQHLEGLIFHRSEYGGLLQELGYTHGEVYADTGFGKYSPEFIHEIELVGDRASYAPLAMRWYKPDIVLCGNYSHLWPSFLRADGWRLVFYRPGASVWLRPGFRPDLVTVTPEEVIQTFRADKESHGLPASLPDFARNIVALESMGLGTEAVAQARALPEDLHEQGFYWDMIAIMTGMDPPLSPYQRQLFIIEAQTLVKKGKLELVRPFLIQVYQAKGDLAAANTLLETPPLPQDSADLEIQVQALIKRKEWDQALSIIKNTDLFDLRSGLYYSLRAQCHEHFNQIKEATDDWNLAIYCYPDDPQIREAATTFASRVGDDSLKQKINTALHFYGP